MYFVQVPPHLDVLDITFKSVRKLTGRGSRWSLRRVQGTCRKCVLEAHGVGQSGCDDDGTTGLIRSLPAHGFLQDGTHCTCAK